jgi:serine/threonine protein kinase
MKGRRHGAAGSGTTTFPGYADIAEIAAGTFATVYQATELGTGRQVALKVLRVADPSPHLVELFDQELGALALLSSHPNVTTLYRTFVTPEGHPVLVLELCRGSLAQRVRQTGPMTPAEVVQVGVKIAGALGTAHRSGLLHRDMKPENILVSQFGEPVLGDFGVAALQAAAEPTEGIFGFTTLHAPPEALEGLPLGPASDIYGLASSMYQLCLGHGPFAAYQGEAPASVILRILRDPAPRPPVAAVPIDLADLFERALAKDPRQRPQTADAFADELRLIEATAGWPPTPYVVWGSSRDVPDGRDWLRPTLTPPVPPPASGTPRPLPAPAVPTVPDEPWRPRTVSKTPAVPAAAGVGPSPGAPPPGLSLGGPPLGGAPPGGRTVLMPTGSGRNVLVPVACCPGAAPTPSLPARTPASLYGPPAKRDQPVVPEWMGPEAATMPWGPGPGPGAGPGPQAPATTGRTSHRVALVAVAGSAMVLLSGVSVTVLLFR